MPRVRVRRSWLWPMVTVACVIAVAAAGAAAAFETDTVESFWRGLWWSISLLTTVGFIGQPPRTSVGAVLSVFLMIVGFVLLAMVSASLAALFVRDDERPREAQEESIDAQLIASLHVLDERLAMIEARLASEPGPPTTDSPTRGTVEDAPPTP